MISLKQLQRLAVSVIAASCILVFSSNARADLGVTAEVNLGVSYPFGVSPLTPNVGFAWGGNVRYRVVGNLDIGVKAITSQVASLSAVSGSTTVLSTVNETQISALARYYFIMGFYGELDVGTGITGGGVTATIGSVSANVALPLSTGFGGGAVVGYDFNLFKGLYLGPQFAYSIYTGGSIIHVIYGLATVSYRF